MKQKQNSALITGASSGIGAAFARRLAADGYHIILVARREEKLKALAEELEAQHAGRMSAEVLVADLAKARQVAQVEARIRELDDLQILINNAGFGTTGKFAEIDLGRQLDMIHVHLDATVRLTRAALPGMIARQHGAIINVSSIAAFFTNGENATYNATKAFLNSFSESLQLELKGTNVQVQALCPGFTYSQFHDTSEYQEFTRDQIPQVLWMSAKEVVTESLDALKREKVIFIPGRRNRWLVATFNPITMPLMRALRKLMRRS